MCSSDLAHSENKNLGLLERTLQEFTRKGYNSLEEIKDFLQKEHKLTVTTSILEKRLEAI